MRVVSDSWPSGRVRLLEGLLNYSRNPKRALANIKLTDEKNSVCNKLQSIDQSVSRVIMNILLSSWHRGTVRLSQGSYKITTGNAQCQMGVFGAKNVLDGL